MMSIRHSLQHGGIALAIGAVMLTGCDPKTPAPKAVSDASQPAQTQTTTTTTTTVVERSTTPVAAVTPPPSMTTSTVAAAPRVQDGPAQPAWQPVPAKADTAPATRTAQAQSPVQSPARPAPTRTLGEIRHIEPIHERPQGSGAGAVVGGVLGAVVGNQFGSGNGRAAMTVLGGAGGAVAGNNVERHVNKKVVGYRVSVQLDNGQSRVFEETNIGNLRVGDRVRVDGQHVRGA